MRKFSITVFILFLFVFNNALAGKGEVFLNSLTRAAKYLRNQENQKIAESLLELERKLWGKSLGDISKTDVKGLIEADFNPTNIMRNMENERGEFISRSWSGSAIDDAVKTNVFGVVLADYTHSPVFMRWWDQADFRNYTFTFIKKPQLTENEKLLLGWWDELKIRTERNNSMEGDKLLYYIRSSLQSIVEQYPSDFAKAVGTDPFLLTVFKAINESDSFADDIEPVLDKLFREFNIDGSGKGPFILHLLE